MEKAGKRGRNICKFIHGLLLSVYNFPAQWRPSFENQRILNFGVMAVCDMKIALAEKYTLISRFLAISGVKVLGKEFV